MKVLWENKEETKECKRDNVKPTLDITKDKMFRIKRAKQRKRQRETKKEKKTEKKIRK